MSRNYQHINQEVGQQIRARREELHMTQEELATKLGYKSKSTINKIESGINSITQNKLKAFADALDTTELYLLGLLTTPEKLEGNEVLYEHFLTSLASKTSPLVPYDDDELLTLEEKEILSKYRQLNTQNKKILKNITSDIFQNQLIYEIQKVCKTKNYKFEPEKYQQDSFSFLFKTPTREYMNTFFSFKSPFPSRKYISSLDGMDDILKRYSLSDEEITKLANIFYYSNIL